jgi:hypothetical protein
MVLNNHYMMLLASFKYKMDNLMNKFNNNMNALVFINTRWSIQILKVNINLMFFINP